MKFSCIENMDKSALFNQLQTEAHIWFFRTDVALSDEQRAAYLLQLSVDEEKRYHSFHYEEDKRSYIIAHVLLRNALSKYIDVPVEAWRFACDEHGKPEIVQTAGLPEIAFNLTHTKGLCACVVSLNVASGIDAENINRQCNYKGLAKRMFSDEENVSVNVSENPTQKFYKLWTLREAYVKALGVGLSASSKDYSFTLDDNDEYISLHHASETTEDVSGQFALYMPTDDHILSVAITEEKASALKIKQLVIREVSALT